jgi:hypothetical protein
MKGFIAAMVFSLAPALFAQTDLWTIREVIGTVEIKAPGSGDWIQAHPGAVLERNTVISTGFRSAAVLSLGESLIRVRPLSRLTLEELARRPERDEVSIHLRAGRVRAAVAPPQNGRVNFTIRSALATASVRGTVFDFDTVNLNVHEGWVSFSAPAGPARPVNAGAGSSIDEISQAVTPPVSVTARALIPAAPMGTAGSGLLTAASGTSAEIPGSNPAAPGPDPGPGPDPDPGPGTGPGPGSGGEGFTVDITW